MKTRALLGALFATSMLAGCSLDIGDGSQLGGQRCFQESDCADGLTCSERVCVPTFGARPGADAGNNASNNGTNNGTTNPNNQNNQNNVPINNIPLPDMGCIEGERRCAGPSVVQVCGPNGEVFEEVCPDSAVCEMGFCTDVGPNCRDNDGDGFGPGCERGFDCDDSNPSVNPGARENCQTPLDDNCSGRVNENCGETCCPGGCGPEEFCTTDCACQPFDPGICQYQNQPCFDQGEFDNGFACFAFSEDDIPRCWGICALNAADPDSTCPEPGSVCAFDAGDGQNGICLSSCGLGADGVDRACGEADLGCLNIDVGDRSGACVPINSGNGRGDRCDLDNFFDCAEGLICIEGNGNGNNGRCREACRPFANAGMGTDCDQGHCLAYSAAIGVCINDNNSTEGDACAPRNTACNADAVGCYDIGDGQECVRLCRQDEGDADCTGSRQACTAFDPQQTELGVCL